MGIKRLITASIIVATILASVGVLLFQVGADEQLMSTVLPRVEKKLGLKITYQDSDASLTSLTLRGVQISKSDSGGLLAVIKTIVVGFRVGPLFFGKLDVTGIRILGLDARIGRKAGGASLMEWAKILGQFLGKRDENSSTFVATKTMPEIRLEESNILFNDGRFAFAANGASGTLGAVSKPTFLVNQYHLSSSDLNILRGSALVAEYNKNENQLSMRGEGPTIDIPVEREMFVTLVLDLTKSIVHARNLLEKHIQRRNSAQVESDILPSEKKKIIVNLTGGIAKLNNPVSRAEPLSLTAINTEINGDTSGNFVTYISGKFSASVERFSIAINRNKNSIPKIKINLPDTAMGSFENLLPSNGWLQWKDAHAGGSLEIVFDPTSYQTDLAGNLNISGLTIFHKRLASVPLENVNFRVDFNSTYKRPENILHFDRLRITRGRAQADLSGDIQPGSMNIDLHLNIPPTPCQQLLSALPAPFRQNLRRASLGGLFNLNLHLLTNEENPDDTDFEVQVGNNCHIESYGNLPDSDFFKGPFAYVAYTGQRDNLRLITGPGTDRWTSIHFISPYVIDAVITTEDSRFWSHKGVTVPEVRRSIVANLRKKDLRHGASTITMQLAKNLFLSRERTIARKFQELFYVWYLESHFQKREILELYLNIVEFGPSIYGIRDATGYYFGREPSELTLLESLFLIKLLPAPVPRHAIYQRGFLKEKNLNMLHRALSTMRSRNRITDFEYQEALQQEIVFHKQGQAFPPRRPPVRRTPNFVSSADDQEQAMNSY